MSITCQDYLNDVQRLLHDATYRFWTQAELINYINKARKLTVADTGCTRQSATVNIISASTLADATYAFSALVSSRQVIDVMNVMVNYGSIGFPPLRYLPYDTIIRTALWQTQRPGWPSHYTVYGRSVIILPWPSKAYASSIFDCVVEPSDLVTTTDVDNDLFHPYSECVGFYAAYLAKLKDQRRQDADEFLLDYHRRKLQAIGTAFTRRLVGQ